VEIVGACQDTTGLHGFFLAPDSVFIILDAPGSVSTTFLATNLPGHIVGSDQDATGFHGVLTDSSTWTTIDVPGAYRTVVVGVNDATVMSGQYLDSTGTQAHGFITADGVNFTTLDYPGIASSTYGAGISNGGSVVGAFRAADTTYHGFLFDGTTYTQIDVPGASNTIIQAISSDGSKLAGVISMAAACMASWPPGIRLHRWSPHQRIPPPYGRPMAPSCR
jgi:probable HAF family extracellular repeat protein